MIVKATAWTLEKNAAHRRESPRPAHLRQAGFEELFDARTVFYDCFRLSPAQVLLLGPPLVKFAGVLDSLRIKELPGGHECRFRVEHKLTVGMSNRQVHNLCRILIDAPHDAASLGLQCAAGHTVLQVAPAGTESFRGKRVLFTMSRDNDPLWICDWMRFHRDMHHADAVLLYDNGSTAYSTAELLEAMCRVSGFATIAVVEWPYPFGPQGVRRGTWDSAFCQDGALEDARWRFLREAYAILSCDVDELILTTEGDIFEHAACSPQGYVRFTGRWVSPPRQAGNGHLPRHWESTQQLLPRWRWKDFRLKDLHLSPPKWAVVPARCPEEAHWSIHEIVGMKTRIEPFSAICYRHMEKITTNWKSSRANSHKLQGAAHKHDAVLEEAFAKVRWAE